MIIMVQHISGLD